MAGQSYLLPFAVLSCVYLSSIFAQNANRRTRFTCQGRASGYYADVDTGCQVYHMCDGLGRQFSYSCPNTTLFQQRMLICDHWYMVNCSMSERDYSANLLIGQRDKPFVSEAEMRLRTPRPDILSVPPNNNYYDGLKEAESKFPVHPSNSIVGIADSISHDNNNGLDSAKQNYRPPSSWSTGIGVNNQRPSFPAPEQDNAGAASLKPSPTFRPTEEQLTQNTVVPTTPFRETNSLPSTTEASSEEFDLDVRMRVRNEEPTFQVNVDPVFNFIKRFDPNSPDSHKTAMTKTEIINLNEQLPAGQASAEEERTPRRNKNSVNNFNKLLNDKKSVEGSRFDTVNVKPTNPTESTLVTDQTYNGPTLNVELVPPKRDYSNQATTTHGPPIYYEWKWAAPAFDLAPPKEDNNTAVTNNVQEKRNISGRSPFSSVTRPTPIDLEPTPPIKNTEYNVSSYFVPDYLFPLDKAHPGYEDEDAQTSFQVKIASGKSNYGENPACPHCHPAYLNPGTCEPCIVKR